MFKRALALCLMIGGIAAPAVATGASPPPALLGGLACRQAQNPLDRMVEITATMRPLPGTERMALRFQLLEAQPGLRFHKVYGGDLGKWRYPNPPTFGQQPGDTWIVNKPVANLAAPARYRFRVTFRWVAWSGRVTTRRRLSTICREGLKAPGAG